MTLLRSFIASSDKTYKKVKASDGRIMHFKDGTPISESTFNMVSSRWHKYDGEYVNIAIPSDKGPGYERMEITPAEATSLGKELSEVAYGRQAADTVTLQGETFETDALIDLNDRIIASHGGDAVFKYA